MGGTALHPPEAVPRPELSLGALRRLREHIRRAFLLDGAAALALTASLVVAATFALDFTLVLPKAVRAVLLASSLGYLGWVLVKRVVRPGSLPLKEEDLAVLVEARAPELKQALITAVDLTRAEHLGARYLSPALISMVVRQAEESSAAIRPGRVVNLGPASRNSLLFGALTLVILGGASARPDLAGIWFERVLFLGDERWPKRTRLELVHPKENPVVVSLGEELPVEVKALRGAPASVVVEAESQSGRWRDRMAETGQGVYHKVFENVSQRFRFRAMGGDDELPWVEVRVRIEPSLARVDAWYRYPQYTALASTPPERPVTNPSLITVPAGTRVAFRAYTDLEVKRAFLVFKPREETAPAPLSSSAPVEARDRPWPEPGAVELPVEPAAEKPAPPEGPEPAQEAERVMVVPPERVASMFDGSFTVERDGHFYFQLLAADEVPGRRGKVIAVRAIPDRKPSVRIIEPSRSSEEVSPQASVPMEFLIRDDYGVRAATLEGVVFSESGEPLEPQSLALSLSPPADPAKRNEHRTRMVLELKTLAGAVPGARFQYYARAEDHAGQTGESERHVLHIVAPENITRIINDRLMLIRDQLREVSRLEESARKDLESVERELLKAATREGAPPPSVDAAAAGRMGRHRQDQERVTAGLGRVLLEFDHLLSKMEANKVGAEKERGWIGGLRRDVEELAGKSSPGVEGMIERLRDEAARSPQPIERLQAIGEAERKIEREIGMLVLRLTEFGDLNAVIQQLRDLERRQREIRDRTRERARREGGQ